MLIAAVSGRALAAAARADGFAPLVADLFGDDDTRALAAAFEVVPGSLTRGPVPRSLLAALDRLASGRAPIGVVYGGGLEGRPRLLRALARFGLLGTRPEAVARLKDPFAFAALCRACDVPHPEVAPAPGGRGDWLEKRAGAGGGTHIRPARAAVRPPRYLQRRVAGRPVAALLLGDGRDARVLGFSEQWAAPTPAAPFRYGGAARPAMLTPSETATLTEAATRVAVAGGVVGLASADFLLGADGFHLLEINPRPGATLDVFTGLPLFAWHVAACAGGLPADVPALAGGAAAQTVFAARACRVPAGFTWPEWAADRQRPGPVPAGAPLATVVAAGQDAAEARAMAKERAIALLTCIEEHAE